MTNQIIVFLSFLVLLRQELYHEEQIFIRNQHEHQFIDKWAWLYDQLLHILDIIICYVLYIISVPALTLHLCSLFHPKNQGT